MLRHLFMVIILLFSFHSLAKEVIVSAKPSQEVSTHDAAAKTSTASKVTSTAFIEGKHYRILENPLPQSDAPVMEFMYYGCKTCFQLAPAIAEWSYTTKIGVMLVPAHSDTAMIEEARMFHTFEVMGVLGKMYEEGFVIFQTDQTKLQGAERVNSFLAQHAVDKNKFWDVWKSDAVKQRLADSAALTKQAKVFKTPTFVVHGIYQVDTDSLKSVEDLFAILSFLAAKKPAIAPPLLRKPS